MTSSRSSSVIITLLLIAVFTDLDALEFPDLIEDELNFTPALDGSVQKPAMKFGDIEISDLSDMIESSRRIDNQSRLRLSVLLSELLGRPDDAYIQLKSELRSEKADWYDLKELYLADLLGMEEEVRLKGKALRQRWFATEFNVGKIALCESVKAFGQYEPLNVLELRARQLMILYVECFGLSQSPRGTSS